MDVMEAVTDFATNLEADGKVLSYSTRRWDMYILLSSTQYSLLLGLIAGIILRIIYEIFRFGNLILNWDTLSNYFSAFNWDALSNYFSTFTSEASILAILFIVNIFLLWIFHKGIRRLTDNFYPFYEASVRFSFEKNRDSLKKAFPSLFHEKESSSQKKLNK